MKKVLLGIVVLCLVSVVCVIAVGCGGSTTTTTSLATSTSAGETTTSAAAGETTTSGAIAAAPASIKIGVCTDLSGPVQTMGERSVWAFQTAVDDINKAGGVFVKEYNTKIPIELVLSDCQSDEAKAPAQMQYLIKEGAVAILGTSSALASGAAIAETNGVTMIMSTSILRQPYEQGYKYLFSFFCLNDTIAQMTVDFLATLPDDQKPKLIGNFIGQDAFGKEGGVFYAEALTAAGYEVMDLPYTRFTTDLSAQILQMKQAGADYVVGGLLQPDGALLMKQSKQLDFNPKGMFLESAPNDSAFWVTLGEDGEYVVTLNNFDASMNYAGAQDLAARYEAAFDEPCFEAVGPNYGCVQILTAAIEAAGTLDKAKIRDAVAATNITTVAGPANFNENGTSNHKGVVVQWLDGKPQVIYPSDMAVAKVVYPMPAWSAR